jgi:hypothetical protein
MPPERKKRWGNKISAYHFTPPFLFTIPGYSIVVVIQMTLFDDALNTAKCLFLVDEYRNPTMLEKERLGKKRAKQTSSYFTDKHIRKTLS